MDYLLVIRVNYKKAVILNCSEKLFVEKIVLIFILIRKSFFVKHNYFFSQNSLAWHTKFEKRKTLKTELNEELMPVAWNPIDGGIGVCQKMRKKEIDPI